MFSVYKHTNKISGKTYVGITSQPVERRWRADGSGYKKCPVFYRAITKYGWDNFSHEVIKTGLTREEAEKMEREIIKETRSNIPEYGYNIAVGGMTHEIDKRTREKIRQTLKKNYVKEKHPNYGKHFDDELRKKLSEAHKGKKSHNCGKKMSEEQKRKISKTLKRKGIAPSLEAREKARQAIKGNQA